jgi:hypothetical protein
MNEFVPLMVQITAQMRVLAAIEAVDGRKGPSGAIAARVREISPGVNPSQLHRKDTMGHA